MVFAGWCVFLALITWMIQGALDRQYNPNTSPSTYLSSEVREVVLERNRAAHYVVSGGINNQAVEFLVDTGATDIALSERTAGRLGIRRGQPVTLSTANGLARGYRSVADRVSVGGIVMTNVPVVVSPGIDDNTVLLGMSFLKHLELVQRDGKLILRQFVDQTAG